MSQNGSVDISSLRKRAQAQLEAGHFGEAIACIDEALRLDPENRTLLAERGEGLRLQGDYQEALADFEAVLDQCADDAWALNRKGDCLREIGNYSAARKAFDRGLELDGSDVWALAKRGATLFALSQPELAMIDFNVALALKPDYAQCLIYRAKVFSYFRCFHVALADIAKARKLEPDIWPYWRGETGLIYNAMGLYSKTIDCCRVGIAEDPEDIVAYYSWVVAQTRLYGLHETQEDIDQLRDLLLARMRGDGHLAVTYRLAGLAALQGQKEAAIDLLATVIHLDRQAKELARHDPAFVDCRLHSRWATLYGLSASGC